METSDFKEKINITLISLGLGHWRVCWLPESTYPIRGRAVPEKLLIEIYDPDEEGALETLIHEVIEIKLSESGKLMVRIIIMAEA